MQLPEIMKECLFIQDSNMSEVAQHGRLKDRQRETDNVKYKEMIINLLFGHKCVSVFNLNCGGVA